MSPSNSASEILSESEAVGVLKFLSPCKMASSPVGAGTQEDGGLSHLTRKQQDLMLVVGGRRMAN